jgi:hypothetical protein
MSLHRKRLSTTLRFEVLKRDNFTCQYCGATKADAELTVDHVKAIDAGGKNEAANLVTACADCNRGKSNTPNDEQQLPPIAGPQDPGSLRGPYFERTSERWKLKWTEDGVEHQFTNAAREVVAAKRAEMSGGGGGLDLPALDGFSTADEIRRGYEQTALAANRAARAGRDEALVTLKKYSAVIVALGSAAVPHTDAAENAEALAAVTDKLERINAGRAQDDVEKPPAIAHPATTLKSRAGPNAKPLRSRDPVQN